MQKLIRSMLFSLTAAAFVTPAHAHHIWIEQDAKEARFHFGEFGDNLREVSPGRLDRFEQPSATLATSKGDQKLSVTKCGDAFALSARAGKGEALLIEDTRTPFIEKREGEKVVRTLWVPAARYVSDFNAQSPKLTLDIVPTGKSEGGEHEAQVYYKTQPLPKAKVVVTTTSGWTREYRADEQGRFSFNAPWRGTYVIEVRHLDNAPGERPGGNEAYDSASYVTSLSFVQAKGLAALPATPKTEPKQ